MQIYKNDILESVDLPELVSLRKNYFVRSHPGKRAKEYSPNLPSALYGDALVPLSAPF